MDLSIVVDVLTLQIFLVEFIHLNSSRLNSSHLLIGNMIALDGTEEADLFLCNLNHSLIHCIALNVNHLGSTDLFLLI